jgi:hypothetical protein
MKTRERTSASPRWLAAWAAVWLVVAATAVLVHMVTFTKLSLVDEYQHVDYLDKTMSLEHVNGGERVGDVAMREQACRGMDLPGFELPPCDAPRLTPEQFPGAGFNHTFADPPTYYAITGPLSWVTKTVTGVDSIVTAARAIGVLWLGLGLLLVFLLARRLGADEWAAAGATLLLASTPVVLGASATVTTDAPLLAVGGVVTLLAVSAVQGRISPWWTAVGAAAAMAFKTTSLTVVGMVTLFLLLTLLARRRAADDAPGEQGRPRLGYVHVVAMLAAAAVPLVAWTAVTSATSLPEVDEIPAGQMFKVDSIGWTQIAMSFRYLFTPVNNADTAPFLRTDAVDLSELVVNVLLILGTAGVAWFGLRGELASRLGTAVFAAMVLGGPALAVMLFVAEGVSYTIPGRYGLSLLPAAAACVAVAASRRPAGGPGLVALGTLGMVAYLLAAA